MTSLYLSYDGLTDPLGQSQILPYLLGLEKKDVVFHIVSFEKKENFGRNKDSVYELIKDKNIHWHPLAYHKKPPVLSTVYDLYRLRQQAKHIIKENSIQIVHCRSYVTSLVGLWLKRKRGLKFIFDMRGFWADERVEGGLWNIQNPVFKAIYNYFKRKEKQFLLRADAVISLTENAKSHIANELSYGPQHKISVIPCCADLNLFCHPGKKEMLPQPGNNFSFKLLYLGSLGTWYLFDEMIAFFKSLATAVPKSQFVLLTNDLNTAKAKLISLGWKITADGRASEDLPFKFSSEQFSEAEIVVTQAARNEVPDYIASSDASVMFIKPSFSKKASSATKMGEVLAMGKPVITNAGWGDVELFKAKIDNFYVAESFDEGEYAKIIQKLVEKSAGKPEIPSPFALDYFSLQNGVEKYYEVYQNLSDMA